jgi:hypothetical protein
MSGDEQPTNNGSEGSGWSGLFSWVVARRTFAALFAVAALAASEMAARATDMKPAVQSVIVPGIDFQIVLDPSKAKSGSSTYPEPALLTAITSWLSKNFVLPPVSAPFIDFRSPGAMIAMRYGGIASDRLSIRSIESEPKFSAGSLPDVVSLYEDGHRTIHLPTGWSGSTAAELSMLVHEMVHHMQNVAGLKYECPEAREGQAFTAQEQWLRLFGTDLNAEFGLDPFTLLVRTNCAY